MAAMPETGFLVFADLTGYTGYLAGSELEHAPMIAGDLLETIVGRSNGGRRGVGTITQCVTGRLATIEEVVDWQPYDHIGWRVTVPDLGSVGATVELHALGTGTRLHLRWTVDAPQSADARAFAAIQRDKRAALERLARLLDDA